MPLAIGGLHVDGLRENRDQVLGAAFDRDAHEEFATGCAHRPADQVKPRLQPPELADWSRAVERVKRYAQVGAGPVNRDGQAEPARRARERLVDGSVHLRLKRRTESRPVQRWVHTDPIDSGTLREALESQHEAELVQQRWAQCHGKGSAVLERLRHVPTRGGDPGGSILRAVEPEAVQVEQDDGERLRDLLVQLMGEVDPLALVLI